MTHKFYIGGTATTAIMIIVASNGTTFTGTTSGITSTMVGLGNCNNTTDLLKPVSTATQTALDLKQILHHQPLQEL